MYLLVATCSLRKVHDTRAHVPSKYLRSSSREFVVCCLHVPSTSTSTATLLFFLHF